MMIERESKRKGIKTEVAKLSNETRIILDVVTTNSRLSARKVK
jgi:hypothetical protein